MKTKILAILAFTVIFAGNSVYAQSGKTDKKLYQHVLLFKWKDDIDPAQKVKLLKLFKELPPKIDGFEAIDIYDVTKSSDDYNNVFVLQFSSMGAFHKYENHPDHERISEVGPPLLAGFKEFNYWK